MLPLQNRLKKESDFKRILRFGRTSSTINFRLKLAKNQLNLSRFAFITALSLSKKSTVRNRLRRQSREAVRLLLKNGRIKQGFDIIIWLGRGLVGKKHQDINQEIGFLLLRAGLIKN